MAGRLDLGGACGSQAISACSNKLDTVPEAVQRFHAKTKREEALHGKGRLEIHLSPPSTLCFTLI